MTDLQFALGIAEVLCKSVHGTTVMLQNVPREFISEDFAETGGVYDRTKSFENGSSIAISTLPF